MSDTTPGAERTWSPWEQFRRAINVAIRWLENDRPDIALKHLREVRERVERIEAATDRQ